MRTRWPQNTIGSVRALNCTIVTSVLVAEQLGLHFFALLPPSQTISDHKALRLECPLSCASYDSDEGTVTFSLDPPTELVRIQMIDAVGDDLCIIMYSRGFPNPSISKWTKAGPSYDKFLLGFVGDNLKGVAEIALEPLKFNLNTAAPFAETEVDTSYTYNKVQGSRSKRTLCYLRCGDEKAEVSTTIFTNMDEHAEPLIELAFDFGLLCVPWEAYFEWTLASVTKGGSVLLAQQLKLKRIRVPDAQAPIVFELGRLKPTPAQHGRPNVSFSESATTSQLSNITRPKVVTETQPYWGDADSEFLVNHF